MKFKKWTASVTLLTFLFTNLLTLTPNLTRTQRQAEAATAQDGLEYAYIGLNIGVTLKNLGGNKYQLNTPNGNTYTATYNNSGVLWFNGIEATSEFSPISGRSPVAIDNFLAVYNGGSSKIPVSGDTGGAVSGRIYGVNEPNPTKGQQMVLQKDAHASLQSLSVGEGSNYVVYCNAGFNYEEQAPRDPGSSKSLSIAVVMAFRNVKYNGGWSPYDGGGGGGDGGGDVDPPPKPPVGHRVSYTETASPKILRGNYKDVINGKTFDITIKGKLTFRCDNGGDSWLDVTYNGGDYVDYKSTENPTYQYTYHLKADEDWLEPGYALSLKDKWNVSCYHACSEDVGKGTIYHTIQTVFTNQEPTASGKVYMKTGGQTNNLWRERDIVFEDTSTDPENDLMDRKYVVQYEKDGTYINVANIVETRTSSTGAWTFNVTGVDNTYIKKVTPNQKGFIFQVMKKGNYQIKQDVGDVNNLPAVTQLWDNNDDNLCRFIVDKDPAPPVADFDYMIGTKVVTSAFVGANVTLKNKSTDPDDDISVYSWVPKYVTPTNGTFTKGPLNTRDTWIVPGVIGSMSTKLTVTDDSGFSDNKTKTLKITPPIPIPDVQVPDPNVDPDNPGGGGGNPGNPDGGGGGGDNPDISVKPNDTLNKYYMKENRLIVFDISNSANPPTQPIKWERTTWKVEKDGVTMGTDKVPYIEAADHKSRKYLFREKGTYKVTVTLHNDYTDNTPGIDMSNAIMSFNVKIKEDTAPNAKIAVTGNSANFRDNPNKTDVTLADATVSKDADFIKDDIVLKPADTPDVAFGRGVKAYDWKVILDANDDGIFDLGRGDKLIYDTRDGASNFNFSVPFTPNTKGNYRIFFTARETFGQKTIPQFVSDADRRVTSITQNFNVNWVPDISYKIANAPIWQYDTQAFTTTIKDERPNTTNVEWAIRELKVGPDYNYVHESGRDSMSKAEWDSLPWLPSGEKDVTGLGHLTGTWFRTPLDTEFAVEWSDVIDESSLTRDGGTIKFKRAGKYRLYAKITDEVGQTYTYYDDVRVLPVPVADLNDQPALRWESVPWQAKQNRLFGTVGGGTVHDPYLDFNWGDFPPTYTPPTAGAGTEIDYSKSKLIISPLDGQNLNTLFVVNQGGQTAIPSERTDCYQVSNVPNEMQMMSKSVGRYNITLQMQNKAGKSSLPTSRTMNVAKDLPPVIDCHVDEVVNRDPTNGNIVTVDIYNIDTTSKDADVVNDIQLQYRYDSNNNGSFEDEAWQNADPIVFDATTQKGSSKFRGNKVGKYQIKLYGREQFGQATLNKYIVAADHLDGEVLRYVTCDNVAPVADLSAQKGQKVDIVFATGNLTANQMAGFNNKVTTYIKNLLASYGTSTIDSVIQTVETSHVDITSKDPSVILKTWKRTGDINAVWKFIQNESAIYDTTYHCHQSSYVENDPNNMFSDFKLSFDTMGLDHSHYGDNMGMIFRQADEDNYYAVLWRKRASCGMNFTAHHGDAVTLPEGELALVKVSDGHPAVVARSTGLGVWEAGKWYTVTIEANKGNFQFSVKTVEEQKQLASFKYVDSTPILKGNVGVTSVSHAPTYFKNLNIVAGNTKSLYDILMGDVTWRDGALKVVVDLEGKAVFDLGPTSAGGTAPSDTNNSGRIAALLAEQGIKFVGVGNNSNRYQFQNLINAIGANNGKFVNLNDPVDTSLQNTGQQILNWVLSGLGGPVQYLLLSEMIYYNKVYSDFENDPQYTSHSKWYYDHEPNFFDNSLGYHDKAKQWLDGSINEFDRTGKYLVTWQTKDNPIGNDERFAEYRKLSSMMNGPLVLYVHRKPIADFTPNISKSGSIVNVQFTESPYDLDHTSRNDKGIRDRKWSWKEVGETSWHEGRKTAFQATKDYLIRFEVQDIDGPNGVGVWSDPKVMLLSMKAQPPVAKFNWSPQILPLGQDISLKDTSYDPNGDPIVEERWVLYFNNAKVGDRTLTNNSGVTAGQVEEVRTWVQQQIEAKGHSGYGGWKLTLQVRDNTGVWGDTKSTSDIYTQNFTVTPNNRPPNINIDTGNGGSITNGGNDNWDPSKPGNNIGNAQPIGYKRNVYVDAVTNDGAVVNSPLLSHRNYLNVLFNPRITVSDPDAGGRFPNHQGFEYSWEFKNHDSLTKVIKSTSEMKDSDIITTKTFGPKQSTSGSEIPFNNGFANNGLKPGPYEMIVSVKDRPIYGNPQTVSGSIKFYVVPNLTGSVNVTPYGDEIMVGEKVKVRVTTDKWTNGVELRMEKNFDVNNPYSNTPAKPGLTWINVPFKENANGTYIYECDYVIPELTDSGDYFFTARLNTTAGSKDVYGVDNRITRYKFITERHAVTALKIIDFVISDMKYHPQYDGLFPIKRPNMPVDYTAGYYVHFKVTTKGEPDKVIGNMKIEGVDAGQIEFVQTGVNGNEQIWEGKWFAPADTDIGSKITIEIEASRGATEYNYNDKEGWDGHTLTVVGSALEDAVINRTH